MRHIWPLYDIPQIASALLENGQIWVNISLKRSYLTYYFGIGREKGPKASCSKNAHPTVSVTSCSCRWWPTPSAAQRFNVAASRVRDRMYLVRSVIAERSEERRLSSGHGRGRCQRRSACRRVRLRCLPWSRRGGPVTCPVSGFSSARAGPSGDASRRRGVCARRNLRGVD